MANRKLKIVNATAEAAAAIPAFTRSQVKLIRERLGDLQGDVYLVSNMAHIMGEACGEEEIERATVLNHMSDLLLKVAEALDPAAIIPYDERATEAAHV